MVKVAFAECGGEEGDSSETYSTPVFPLSYETPDDEGHKSGEESSATSSPPSRQGCLSSHDEGKGGGEAVVIIMAL